MKAAIWGYPHFLTNSNGGFMCENWWRTSIVLGRCAQLSLRKTPKDLTSERMFWPSEGSDIYSTLNHSTWINHWGPVPKNIEVQICHTMSQAWLAIDRKGCYPFCRQVPTTFSDVFQLWSCMDQNFLQRRWDSTMEQARVTCSAADRQAPEISDSLVCFDILDHRFFIKSH